MDYTTEQLNQMTKQQVEAIATGLDIEFHQKYDSKKTLIEWIIFAQDFSEDYDGGDIDKHPDDQTENVTETQINCIKTALSELAPKVVVKTSASPCDKVAELQELSEMVELQGVKVTAQAIGKSERYVKMLISMHVVYTKSARVRNAFNSGKLTWSKLYDLAFRCCKSSTAKQIEQRLATYLA
jgi:hypothetical protein